MGREAAAAGRDEAAEKAFKTALSLDRRVFPAYWAWPASWPRATRARRPPSSRKPSRSAPERAYLAFDRLARAYAACGEPSRFVVLCETIIRQDPRDWRARLALGRHLRAEGRHEEAYGLLLRAVEQNPQALLVHLEMWRTLRALGLPERGPGPLLRHRGGFRLLPRPARLHVVPLPGGRHALALPALPRVEHLRGGAPGPALRVALEAVQRGQRLQQGRRNRGRRHARRSRRRGPRPARRTAGSARSRDRGGSARRGAAARPPRP